MTNRADCYAGCGIVMLAVLGYAGAARFPEASSGLGAGGFPKFVAVCLGILGALQAVKSYAALRRNPGEDKPVLKATDLLGAGMLLVSFGLYIALVRPLFMFLYGERKVLRMAVISAVFSVAAYYLFTRVFYVMLPHGSLF